MIAENFMIETTFLDNSKKVTKPFNNSSGVNLVIIGLLCILNIAGQSSSINRLNNKRSSYIENNADPEDVRIELDAQIQSAAILGIEPTHLDSHAGSVLGIYTGRDFLEITFDLCEKYRLPFNLPVRILKQPFFNNSQKELFQIRIDSAKKRGILLIDDIVP